MRIIGCALLAGAGIWSGVLAARRVSDAVSRCGVWGRMLELTAFELERFRTPLPELFASLSGCLDGMPGRMCGIVAEGLAAGDADLRQVWRRAAEGVPPEEREILLPLGDVLGRFGAEEQSAAIAAAGERMDALRRERQSAAQDKRKVAVGVFSAGGILLAVLLM